MKQQIRKLNSENDNLTKERDFVKNIQQDNETTHQRLISDIIGNCTRYETANELYNLLNDEIITILKVEANKEYNAPRKNILLDTIEILITPREIKKTYAETLATPPDNFTEVNNKTKKSKPKKTI